jgi:tetratricopeptide (TPR) repeat protein
MSTLQDRYDDAMYDFATGDCDSAISKLREILAEDPAFFDAQLSIGGIFFARGDYTAAIEEGHKAEKMKPHDQLVHTNLSRAYMKIGDKPTAEHHGLQARIASWKTGAADAGKPSDPELEMARPEPKPFKTPEKFPDTPWKKNKPVEDKSSGESSS